MEDVLRELLGKRVIVYSGENNAYSDKGTLEAYDGNWVRLRVPSGDLLCFPIYNIRLLKASEADLGLATYSGR